MRKRVEKPVNHEPGKPGKNQVRDEKGRFVPGASGNPSGEGGGRPKGSISLTARIKEALAANDDHKAKIFAEALILQACKGNGTAIKAILDRIDGPVTQTIQHEVSDETLALHKTLSEVAMATRDAILKNQVGQSPLDRTYSADEDAS